MLLQISVHVQGRREIEGGIHFDCCLQLLVVPHAVQVKRQDGRQLLYPHALVDAARRGGVNRVRLRLSIIVHDRLHIVFQCKVNVTTVNVEDDFLEFDVA